MSRKIIITCALTGASELRSDNYRYVPVTPAQIADEASAAANAGASIVHIHVRDPASGRPSPDGALYEEVVQRIREKNKKLLINLTTGLGASVVLSMDEKPGLAPGTHLMSPKNRVAHVVKLKPEICTLDVVTFNYGNVVAQVNLPAHLRAMASEIVAAGVRPQIEVFDTGNVRQAMDMLNKAELPPKSIFQLCLGIPWGAPATAESIIMMRGMLPENTVWAAFGIAQHQFPIVAMSALLGGHVRVGLEDNLYLTKGALSPGNAPLVERAVKILEDLNLEVATPDDAREILSL
jgi:uncharacterized protein (DUF849 family)